MPRKPNPQLRKIVLEETNDGRDVVRYLKSTFMEVEDAPRLFGLRAKDYARTHKIAAARILARLGLEEGKRYLRRNYVPTPFKRVHPEEEDGPKTHMAASTANLYRLVRKETNDGRDIIIRFVEIMKGRHPEYKPHLRMAAAKELIRQIEFDYEDEPAPSESIEPVANSSVARTAPAPDADPRPANPVHPTNPAPDEITDHHANHSSDDHPNPIPNPEFVIENPEVSLARIQRRMHVEDGSAPYRDYAAQYAGESESIYQSIIRRASDSCNLNQAELKAQDLIGQFDRYMTERDPGYRPISVPDHLITKSLEQRRDTSRPDVFDPADYYDLDRDYFYYCMCGCCEECDELDYFLEFMRELEEDYDHLFEDP